MVWFWVGQQTVTGVALRQSVLNTTVLRASNYSKAQADARLSGSEPRSSSWRPLGQTPDCSSHMGNLEHLCETQQRRHGSALARIHLAKSRWNFNTTLCTYKICPVLKCLPRRDSSAFPTIFFVALSYEILWDLCNAYISSSVYRHIIWLLQT